MAIYEVWDLVKVPFPYTNRPVQQSRPALVVAHHRWLGSPALLWVLMVTSATHRRWAGDVEVSDLGAAGLPAASIVRSAKIATVEGTEATPIGRLPEADRAKVQEHLLALVEKVLRPG